MKTHNNNLGKWEGSTQSDGTWKVWIIENYFKCLQFVLIDLIFPHAVIHTEIQRKIQFNCVCINVKHIYKYIPRQVLYIYSSRRLYRFMLEFCKWIDMQYWLIFITVVTDGNWSVSVKRNSWDKFLFNISREEISIPSIRKSSVANAKWIWNTYS